MKQDEQAKSGYDTAYDEKVEELRKVSFETRECRERCEKEKEQAETRKAFEGYVNDASSLGEKLSLYTVKPKLRTPHFDTWERGAHLLFCGFLEGDFSERSFLQMPIVQSGGFMLRSEYGNVLFDPGMGTLSGMRDLGVDLNRETDFIIVSHYHPSARFDLHTLLNELGGFVTGRITPEQRPKVRKRPLFSSRALI